MKSERESQAIDPEKTVQVRRRESIDAHALDLDGLDGPPDSSLEMRWYAANERRKRLFWFVAAAVAISGAILLVGLGRRAMAASEEAQPVLSSVTVVGMRAADAKPESTAESRVVANAPPASGMPSVDIASLPVASTGRILGARGRRLVVDGAVVSGDAAIVQCGKRAIKVGKRKARMIDVPCGGEVTIR